MLEIFIMGWFFVSDLIALMVIELFKFNMFLYCCISCELVVKSIILIDPHSYRRCPKAGRGLMFLIIFPKRLWEFTFLHRYVSNTGPRISAAIAASSSLLKTSLPVWQAGYHALPFICISLTPSPSDLFFWELTAYFPLIFSAVLFASFLTTEFLRAFILNIVIPFLSLALKIFFSKELWFVFSIFACGVFSHITVQNFYIV